MTRKHALKNHPLVVRIDFFSCCPFDLLLFRARIFYPLRPFLTAAELNNRRWTSCRLSVKTRSVSQEFIDIK